ncbi:hypothetical protein GEMRC1_001549 [Eukaryota sp. GEM-RC1]
MSLTDQNQTFTGLNLVNGLVFVDGCSCLVENFDWYSGSIGAEGKFSVMGYSTISSNGSKILLRQSIVEYFNILLILHPTLLQLHDYSEIRFNGNVIILYNLSFTGNGSVSNTNLLTIDSESVLSFFSKFYQSETGSLILHSGHIHFNSLFLIEGNVTSPSHSNTILFNAEGSCIHSNIVLNSYSYFNDFF